MTGINWKKEFLGKNWGRIKYKGQKLTNFKKTVFGPKKQVGAELKEKWVWGPKIENFQKRVFDRNRHSKKFYQQIDRWKEVSQTQRCSGPFSNILQDKENINNNIIVVHCCYSVVIILLFIVVYGCVLLCIVVHCCLLLCIVVQCCVLLCIVTQPNLQHYLREIYPVTPYKFNKTFNFCLKT